MTPLVSPLLFVTPSEEMVIMSEHDERISLDQLRDLLKDVMPPVCTDETVVAAAAHAIGI